MHQPNLLEQFFHIRRLLNLQATQSFRELDIGPLQGAIIRLIEKTESPSLALLAKATSSDPAAIGRAFDSLAKRGYVVKTRHPVDKRQWVLGLTAKGRNLAPRVAALFEDVASTFAAGLTGDEQRRLAAMQDKLIAHLTTHAEGEES